MRYYYDLEATGLLGQMIDYKTLPFKLKPNHRVHCAVFEEVDTGVVHRFAPEDMDALKEILLTATELIGHNIINYDMRLLQLYFGIDYEIDLKGVQDTVNGKPCKITDTLIWSRVLNPDRLGGHSLKAWGKRLGVLKGDFAEDAAEDVWDVFTEDMLDYNEQDVVVTREVYKALIAEKGKWPWEDAYTTEKITAHLVSISEHVGFKYDKNLADKCLKELNGYLKDIEENVEPLLPPKKMGKTASKDFIPPTNQLKENGEMTSHMFKFITKVGGDYKKTEAKHLAVLEGESLELPLELEGAPKTQQKKDGSPSKALLVFLESVGGEYKYIPPIYEMSYKGNLWTLPLPEGEPIEKYEPMRLANQKDLKEYLVRMGWSPSDWSIKEMTVDSKKVKLTHEKFVESVKRYCLETKDSPFKKFRYEHMKVSTARQMYEKMIKQGLDRPMKVLTSPKFTVGLNKDLCPDLERLGDKAGFVADVVKWLTYRHRRNAIESPNGTGFNSYYREDGRIGTPAISCGAATSRFKHSVVCNIPRVTSVYGEPIRSLFGVDKGFYQIGYDFSSLEAKVEAHYTIPYTDGDIYAESLVASKPNDIHTVNATKMGVTRDEAKTMKYAISYGAQPARLASQMDWSMDKAKATFEGFWDAALPLKELKEDITKFWLKTGKKFIRGVDGRKLWIRSEHSILNMLFQSTGVIAAKKANIFHNIELQERGLLFNPFKDSSWDKKAAVMILYHDEGQIQVHKSLIKEFTFESKEEAEDFSIENRIISGVHERNGKFICGFSPVGELASLACKKASDYYNLNVELSADYDIGHNWAECH